MARLWPFLVSPKSDRGRLVPLEQMPAGTREAVLNRSRARRGLSAARRK